MDNYLDGTGLGRLLEKIKATFIKKSDSVTATTISIDSAPTSNSTNLVTSGGVKTALDTKQDTIDSSHKLSADLISDGTTNKAYTATEKTKLSGIAAGAEVNVQANWTESSSSSDAYIKNKPNLATVATSGSYTDLSNKPTIPDISGKQDVIDSSHKLSADLIEDGTTNKVINVKPDWNAASGTAAEILNKPTIPAAQIQSDWNQSNSSAADFIKNKPTVPTITFRTWTTF